MKKILTANLLVLLSLMVSVCIGEGVVRLLVPQQLVMIRPDVWCPVAELGWDHCPLVDTRINSGERSIHFHTDAKGHRINPARNDAPAALHILAIGDSFVEAIQVEDDQTIPEQLADQLENRLHSAVRVTNAGTGQWDPNHYLLKTRQELARSRYDVGLIFLYIGNDIIAERVDAFPPRQPTLRRQVKMPRNPQWGQFVDAILYPLDNFFKTRSHLYLFFKHRAATLRMQWGLSGKSIAPIFLKSHAADNVWRVTTTISQEIAGLFRQAKIPVFFVLIPTAYQVDSTEFDRLREGFHISADMIDLEQPNRLLAATFHAAGLQIIDALGPMRLLTAQGQQLYGKVDTHCNVAGYRALALLAASAIEGALGL